MTPRTPVSWTSSDPSVVQISGNTATALKPGSSTVTAIACGVGESVNVTVLSAGYSVTAVNVPDPAQVTYQLMQSGQVVALSPTQSLRHVWDNASVASTYLDGCVPRKATEDGRVMCVGDGPRIWENGVITVRDTLVLQGNVVVTAAGYVFAFRPNGPNPTIVAWRGPGDVVEGACALCIGLTPATNNRLEVGIQRPIGGYSKPGVWRGGTSGDPVSMLPSAGRQGEIAALNDSSDAVGATEYPSGLAGRRIALMWQAPQGAAVTFRSGLGFPWRGNDVATHAVDINNRREAIGFGSQGHFVYSGGRLSLLNQILADPAWQVTSVHEINDNGRILATATKDGVSHRVILDPPPLPRRF